MTYTVIEEKAMSMAELKKELAEIKKRDKELNYRSNKTEAYIATFSKLDEKKAEEMCKKIDKLEIPRFRDMQIKKIVDLMPTSVEDLKVILQGYTMTVSNESLKKIMGVLEDYQKK
jgi:DNA-directed RNA polymerase subunit F